VVTFRRDDQDAEKPTFYDGIQLGKSHLYATTGFIQSLEVEEIFWLVYLTTYKMEVVISSTFFI
jgi:hypothetical protein